MHIEAHIGSACRRDKLKGTWLISTISGGGGGKAVGLCAGLCGWAGGGVCMRASEGAELVLTTAAVFKSQ